MKNDTLHRSGEQSKWMPLTAPEDIPCGDVPGDKVQIGSMHVMKANVIFPKLLELVKPILEDSVHNRAVIAVCGGSGAGKSGIAALLSFYFNQVGIGSYMLSGDNYPRRIPCYNDMERLRVFREAALKGMIHEGEFSMERFQVIQQWQREGRDADSEYIQEYPWFSTYIRKGREGLEEYLGTNREISFEEIDEIIQQFKDGEDAIWLRRMGRREEELWYEQVDFSQVNVLIIDWTHGNSNYYEGVDIPILLNSTPQETLEYRRARNRDADTDSPFTMMVLDIEQRQLYEQAHKAKLILSSQGELLSYNDYQLLMTEEQ